MTEQPLIGGSTIAAAAGIDPWCSRVELFYRLRGELPGPTGEQLAWGQRVQPLIFDALRERGIEAWETLGFEVRDDATPWLVGHPDGISDYAPTGAPIEAIIEAKLTGGYGYRKGDALPLNWQAQVQTYMHLGHVERAIVAVLVGGIRLDVHEVRYDEKATSLLVERAAEFVGMFREGTIPPPDGSESARAALVERFPRQEPGKVYRLTGEEWDAAKTLALLREQRDEVERQITELENRIKATAPDAETFIDPYDGTFATWKEVTSNRLDTKALREALPEIAQEFTRETTTRRFAVT